MGGAAMSVMQFAFPQGPIARALIAAIFAGSVAGFAQSADARITRIALNPPTVVFGGASFGTAGVYERIDGVAYGEVDPKDPLDAQIQDIGLAPLDSSGRVAYSTQVVILRPVQLNQGNATMLFEIVNRGNMLNPACFNVGSTALTP